MEIKTLEVAGIGPAIHAMRNPFDSWGKSDTHLGQIGPVDRDLSDRLTSAGPAHAKHLRMCQVWAEIWAPRYWWMEFSTHRHGMEMLSCSTMHTIHKREFTREDFECAELVGIDWSESDVFTTVPSMALQRVCDILNQYRKMFLDAKAAGDNARAKLYWKQIILLLPQSYIQRRTVMISYQTLRSMYELREGHRLTEWQTFREWCETLPESWMITGKHQEVEAE